MMRIVRLVTIGDIVKDFGTYFVLDLKDKVAAWDLLGRCDQENRGMGAVITYDIEDLTVFAFNRPEDADPFRELLTREGVDYEEYNKQDLPIEYYKPRR